MKFSLPVTKTDKENLLLWFEKIDFNTFPKPLENSEAPGLQIGVVTYEETLKFVTKKIPAAKDFFRAGGMFEDSDAFEDGYVFTIEVVINYPTGDYSWWEFDFHIGGTCRIIDSSISLGSSAQVIHDACTNKGTIPKETQGDDNPSWEEAFRRFLEFVEHLSKELN